MVQPLSPELECEVELENYGRFIVSPLESGFGITLGNALRRVLLSSLPGTAITAVHIEGIQHEFSTIPYVKEDMIDFLLNVKQIRLRSLSDHPGRLMLEAAGEGSICAGDIKPSANFEVVNPELHLATLDSVEAKLNVEFYVEQGTGYAPASHGDGTHIGVIPVAAIFSPIQRVNYAVEKTRLGQVSNYDRLTLEVWTDNTISPKEAIIKAAQILIDHLSLFSNLGKPAPSHAEKEALLSIPAELYHMPLEELGLPVRILNSLRRSKITTVEELGQKNEQELLRVSGFGQKSIQEVRKRLVALGLASKVQGEETAQSPEGEAGEQAAGDEKPEEGQGEVSPD